MTAPELPEDLALVWAQTWHRWGDPQAHRRFIGLCHTTGRLAEAGKQYRYVRDHHPDRATEAEQQLGRVLALAMEMLEDTRTPRRQRPTRLFYLALGVSTALSLYALWALLQGGA